MFSTFSLGSLCDSLFVKVLYIILGLLLGYDWDACLTLELSNK